MSALLHAPPPPPPPSNTGTTTMNPRGRLQTITSTAATTKPQNDWENANPIAPLSASSKRGENRGGDVLGDLTNSSRKQQLPASKRNQNGSRSGPQSPDYHAVAMALAVSLTTGSATAIPPLTTSSTAPLHCSPTGKSKVPPPPPLLAILSSNLQQRKDLASQSVPQGEASSNDTTVREDGGSQQQEWKRSLPQPPPVIQGPGTSNNTSNPTKLLTKYHFLKSFAVKPKTPSAEERQRPPREQRNRNRHGVSPLPAPPSMPSYSQVQSPQPQQQCHPALLTSHHGNAHRVIAQLDNRPVVSQQPPPPPQQPHESSSSSSCVGIPSLVSKTRMGQLATMTDIMPTAAHIQAQSDSPPPQRVLRRNNSVGAPLITRTQHPSPCVERDVARNLMEDMAMATPEPPRASHPFELEDQGLVAGGGISTPADEDGEDELAFPSREVSQERGSEERRNLEVAGDEVSSPPAPPTVCSSSDGGSYPRQAARNHCEESADKATPSYELPSPTTMASTTSKRTVTSSCVSPHSVASTAEGFDLLFEDNDVSPMSDNNNSCPRRAAEGSSQQQKQSKRQSNSREAIDRSPSGSNSSGGGAYYGGWESIASGSGDVVASRRQCEDFFHAGNFALTPIQLEEHAMLTEHMKLATLLMQRAHVEVVELLVLSTEVRMSWQVATFESLFEQYHSRKLRETFVHWSNECLSLMFAIPTLEAHGRMLTLMGRDLFMRGAVRSFIRCRPSPSRRNMIGRKDKRQPPPPPPPLERSKSDGVESSNNRHRRYLQGQKTTNTSTQISHGERSVFSPLSPSEERKRDQQQEEQRKSDDDEFTSF